MYPGCKLTRPDQSTLWVAGTSAEATIKFGTYSGTRVGTKDYFYAGIYTANGTYFYGKNSGISGKTTSSFGQLAAAKLDGAMYLVHSIKATEGAATCTNGDCCFVEKFVIWRGAWVATWRNTIDDIVPSSLAASCFANAAMSSDGMMMFAGGREKLSMFDADTGPLMASKTITGSWSIRGLAVIGTDLFAIGTGTGPTAVSVDSVTISSPYTSGSAEWGYIIRFTTTSSSFTASAGTWIGTDEFSARPTAITPAYNITGYPKALAITLELRGSKLKTGTGYTSPDFHTVTASSSFQYGVSRNPPTRRPNQTLTIA